MSRLFISHSSKNDEWAVALRDWLVSQGWSGHGDIFLDLDPERGIGAGQRWARALEEAATRCEAVLFLVSEDWLKSKWCVDEYQLANKFNKKLFALLIQDLALERLPGGLTAQWQIVRLNGEPAERFVAVHPRTQRQHPVHIATNGLRNLKLGLEKAGIATETFELQPDRHGPFGWRTPYRGLEALEPEDAAVFFGRSADIARGIDALRGLAARTPPRLIVVLGASGAGKSSFLRAGLWPRLLRDDTQWLPLRTIRASRGGAINGNEGLLAALEEVHRRFALRVSRADLRERLDTPDRFIAVLRELREAAARRALITEPPYPLPVLCLDQGEELFADGAGAETQQLLALARHAADSGQVALLVTIRSDSYGLMQGSAALAGVDQVLLSLGPVPHGEIARVIREPSEVLRRKAGPSAPLLDPAVVEQLQAEVAGEPDALPLLAFVLQRLMREHEGHSTIGLRELERTGGVAAAIEWAAEEAFAEAGYGAHRAERLDALRRLFIPRLARIDRASKTAQRRVGRQAEVPSDLLLLVRALTERRLLVGRLNAQASGGVQEATLEVAHEALLRRWPTLAELMNEDRDALLLLDAVISAAADWDKVDARHKADFLAHRGSRLLDALTLAGRGAEWQREVAPAQEYLAACCEQEAAEAAEKEAAISHRRRLQRRTAQMGALVGVLILGIGAGLAWANRTYLQARAVELAEIVWPRVLTPTAERALTAGSQFRECADCPTMVVIPAGEFIMGSPKHEPGHLHYQEPRHLVRIRQSFAISRFEVTFEQWDACVTLGGCSYSPHDQGWGRGTRPAIFLSWHDAQQYVAWLSRRTGKPYRLLSESEWEYAARAGSDKAYAWGDAIGTNNANCGACGSQWDSKQTAPVGAFAANAFGLHDMHGNVWEWVQDCVHESYVGAPDDGSPWTSGGNCEMRIVRGGNWVVNPERLRSAHRIWIPAAGRDSVSGLRVARTLAP